MKKNQQTANGTNLGLILLATVSAIVFFVSYYLIDTFVVDKPYWLAPAIVVAELLLDAIIILIVAKRSEFEKRFLEQTSNMERAMSTMMRDVHIPCILTLKNGIIAWASKGAYDIFNEEESLFQKDFNDYSDVKIEELIASLPKETDGLTKDGEGNETPVIIGSRNFNVAIYRKTLAKNTYYLITFRDMTEELKVAKKYDTEFPVVAYIVLDNLEEIAQYVRVNYRSAANDIETILKDFAEQKDGILKEYDKDKYIMLMPKAKYLECVEDKFDILETVRNVRLGDSSVPVTISMGISLLGKTLAEREKNALSALDLALQRGGDQVVVKDREETLFFGGRTKAVQKKSGSFARVFATQLTSSIASAGNVIIMGHANPDFDSIGACVGVARLCFFCGLSPKIVVNTASNNFKDCTGKLTSLEEYKDVFISSDESLDLVRSDTLLVVCDTNNLAIVESPDLASVVENVIIIDHHRKTGDYIKEPLMSHIDPSASSTSEMVSEILEQSLAGDTLLREEANVLLAGIMVDTKHFTRNTGSKTFSASMFLKNAGGNTETVNTFFDEEYISFLAQARFQSEIEMYKPNVVITKSDGTDKNVDRVAASKMADKLLTIKGVDASFAVVRIGDNIHISARSNGKINVQLILEQLNGGGHFDVAGALVIGKDMDATVDALKNAIDVYLKNEN